MDSKRRSLTKAITWRIAALTTTILVSLIFTGTWELSITIGMSTTAVKTLLFYFHERLWEKTKWERRQSNKTET